MRLSLREVSLNFGGVRALDGVSFDVEPGSVHAVIGPNGAGKSSCFNAVCGIYAVGGSIRLGDRELTGLPPHVVAGLGVARAFQNIALGGADTVLDNLMVARHHLTGAGFVSAGLGLRRVRREEHRHRLRVTEIAEFSGLADVLDTPVAELSYGDRKRVEFARALAMEPRVLLLDEPVAGMTYHEKAATVALIRETREVLGVSVVLVEHDMPLVMGLADRITVLDFGRVIADGPPAHVREHPDVLRAYLGAHP
ncbi:ABC transporter ATP-binding protein [Actinomadura spongiicola]|uniref:ABC transporter ATP-binding protein n=1 Tax=Actinomadura spongiicola TaxID=2303421 RepID=A0A372G9A6_9ACTN|nr:ABC transporter ATP-binding protein [Actinomadura spongiicola]RFS81984.1 ABC transporter ATP-binding protein [Actinomadura spongiicola]